MSDEFLIFAQKYIHMKDLDKMTIDFVDNFDINSIPEDLRHCNIEFNKNSQFRFHSYHLLYSPDMNIPANCYSSLS